MSGTDPGSAPGSLRAKQMAVRLRADLRAHHAVELTHGQCLELVARQHGAADWNTLVARPPRGTAEVPWGAAGATIPVLRIFSVAAALQFYVDFLGFQLDFGGPSGGPGTPYYGQVTRAATTVHLTEVPYAPGVGATVLVWVTGLDRLRAELDARRAEVPVWGPAVWVPEIEQAPWGARVLTLADPFGNHLHLNEPDDADARRVLPAWGGAGSGG
ncbi:glyoxalase superfamily protein [Blastococcus xanthinilyticus]|uniref:Bleomycin resistance protein n=1 Tax=Blastococcus xanthinilyticus TaxID=1564164 RepID=A0A5S5CQT6_9ACTN|nr:glyoxalase superfamily protein [Blastococcus xanthinilyticus]TYP85955.1 putative glyoxalase superfamily protein PhnB [Blastococcus xanthinilyticus]